MLFQVFQNPRPAKTAPETPVANEAAILLPKAVSDYQNPAVRLEAENSLLGLSPQNVQLIRTAMEAQFAKITAEISNRDPETARHLPKRVWDADDDAQFQFLLSIIHLGANRRNALGITYGTDNSTIPQTPNQTMEKGTGDCDDLCLLLKMAARSLDIHAAEGLVLVAASYSFPTNLSPGQNKTGVSGIGHAFFLRPGGDEEPAQLIDPICLFSPTYDEPVVELDFNPSARHLGSDSDFVLYVSGNKSLALGMLKFFGIPLAGGGDFTVHYSFTGYSDLLAYYAHQAGYGAVQNNDFSAAASMLRFCGSEDYDRQSVRAFSLIKAKPPDLKTALDLSDWLMGVEKPGSEVPYFISFVYQAAGNLQKSYEAALKSWENRPSDVWEHARLLVRLVGTLINLTQPLVSEMFDSSQKPADAKAHQKRLDTFRLYEKYSRQLMALDPSRDVSWAQALAVYGYERSMDAPLPFTESDDFVRVAAILERDAAQNEAFISLISKIQFVRTR